MFDEMGNRVACDICFSLISGCSEATNNTSEDFITDKTLIKSTKKKDCAENVDILTAKLQVWCMMPRVMHYVQLFALWPKQFHVLSCFNVSGRRRSSYDSIGRGIILVDQKMEECTRKECGNFFLSTRPVRCQSKATMHWQGDMSGTWMHTDRNRDLELHVAYEMPLASQENPNIYSSSPSKNIACTLFLREVVSTGQWRRQSSFLLIN